MEPPAPAPTSMTARASFGRRIGAKAANHAFVSEASEIGSSPVIGSGSGVVSRSSAVPV